ncbi:MAG: hypothetical protein AAGF99_00050 [Bacteroidota bacterium]
MAVFLVAGVLGLLAPNPLLTAASILVLPLFFKLLWRPGETPVLLLVIGFQWVQATSRTFQANFVGVSLEELVPMASIEKAAWLTLVGLVVLAFGMRAGLQKLNRLERPDLAEVSASFSVERAFLLYLFGAGISVMLGAFAWGLAGLTQALFAAMAIKWVFFFILGYLVLSQKRRYTLFALAIGVEFVTGLGYFAEFKDVFFFALIVVFTVHIRLKPRTILLGIVLVLSLGLIGAVWTSIKADYRVYASGGDETRQVTVVSRSESLIKIAQLVSELKLEDIEEAMFPMFERLAYIDFFAHTLDFVPAVREHEGGRLWGSSIMHFLQPRLLFPNKPVLPSDSELTMAYTGLVLASGGEGTSFSIGYMGESYIDFGPIFMYGAIFLLGLVWGLIYYFFLARARNRLIGYAFATAVLINAHTLEIATVKLFGLMVMNLLVLSLLLSFGESFITSWLRDAKRVQSSQSPVSV